ncbi:MAG: hypothetical protein COZ17_07350 [Flavobacteriaceae bacterium CG_4_10_14_3_um_filter_33_47]|nr:MAG: hypothetical protein COW44_13025 [Flavobacteriaceae bacterium CG17_big_fil_post_rev_8_21_14_2_50_33_15]PIY11242.1 MAG: hypothetical protein COZ17_07350 [Flavobacteriaceae bacterium CG_4_10_14_3_um_filter_33_47]PJB18511.1 MAG: hypothetical protein CO117_07905 [Flavobacteriaceae bacterium CG_4_9_14_3_um_filter_33_16]
MIKLFRNIRKQLLEQGKTTNYLKYAIGEIVLVVIGILIALQINNWNEDRKEKHVMKLALNSLIEDLKQDSIQLNANIKSIQEDMQRLDKFRERLSKPEANIDTLKHIARYEYLPFFNPSNELNRNTIVSLLSTGNLDLFDDVIKNEILKHNSKQLTLIKVMDENVQIFLTTQSTTGIIPQSENPALEMAAIKGPLLDAYWNNLNDTDLINRMMITISQKKMMQYIIELQKEDLYKETLRMIDLLKNYQNTL